jgi:hypothetical protein
MKKTTKWYPGDVRPVRDGLYQRKMGDQIFWSKFENGWWRSGGGRKEFAVSSQYSSPYQNLAWRGLKKEATQ